MDVPAGERGCGVVGGSGGTDSGDTDAESCRKRVQWGRSVTFQEHGHGTSAEAGCGHAGAGREELRERLPSLKLVELSRICQKPWEAHVQFYDAIGNYAAVTQVPSQRGQHQRA